MQKGFRIAMVALTVTAMTASLAGCNKTPTGQVVAVVNGEEITLPELNAEVAGINVPAGVDKTAVRSAALQRVIERHLIAQQARADGLDRDPAYLVRQRQMNDMLLVELYAKRAGDTLAVPSKQTVDSFVAGNPAAFGQRVIFSVDQLRVPPQDEATLAALKQMTTLDQMVAMLNSRGIPFERTPTRIDSAQVDAKTLAEVTALPAGKPFVVAVPQGITASTIVGREAAPLSPERAQSTAAQLVRNQSLATLLEGRLKDLKSKAKIDYQPGYVPKPGAAASATVGTAPASAPAAAPATGAR